MGKKKSQSTAQNGADFNKWNSDEENVEQKRVSYVFLLLGRNMGETGVGRGWWVVHISSQCREIFVHLCFMKLLPKLMSAPKAQKRGKKNLVIFPAVPFSAKH